MKRLFARLDDVLHNCHLLVHNGHVWDKRQVKVHHSMNQRRDSNAPTPKTGTSGVCEEELNAFVDGELDRARMDEISAMIEKDTDLQRQVAEIKQINDQLKTFGQESGNDDALPARIRSLVDSWLKRS